MTADLARIQSLLGDETPLTWVFTGDSITHGLLHTRGARAYVEHLHELIRGDLARVQDAVINTAISGWRIVQLLDDFDRRVATWRPQIVTLMVGTNDCSTGGIFPIIEPDAFAASITAFVTKVREIGAIPVLMTQPTIDVANAPERARIADFAQAIRDVAAAEQTVLVDQFARFAEHGLDKRGGVAWGLMDDPFHPGPAGHALLALEYARTIGLQPPAETNRVLVDLAARVAIA